ncbi:MAG: flippase [Bacteroidia bacterium]|nr:flippase [Bacteroidia bacterium]MBT8268061.1 flippase [Bacteroidia bacterium]NNF82078.1 flippase [Flavobacteriaceae bacterium]NNK68967.1 flippase [Flavobacteriaceae bacterium]NNL81282.1 flippase [Flavobacteriaceae bacterium]
MPASLQRVFGDFDFNEIIQKGFSYMLIRGIGLISSYAFTVYVTKTFGASIFGLFSIAVSIFMIMSIVGKLGLDMHLVKYFSIETNLNDVGLFYRTILKSLIVASLISWMIFIFRFEIAENVFENPKPGFVPYLNWILLSIPLWSITLICSSVSRAQKNIKWFSFISLVSRFVFSLLALYVLLNINHAPIEVAKAHFYGVLITAVLALAHTAYNLKVFRLTSQTNSWQFLNKSLPMMLSSSVLILLGWMDTFVMGVYETDSNVGIYNVCVKVATFTTFTLLAINSILAPKIAKCFYENEVEKYKRLIRFSTKLNFIVSSIVIALILIFNKPILKIFGDEFVSGTMILIILCLGQMINSFSGSVGVILQMIGKQMVHQNFVLMALAINLVLTLALTPLYGGIGAAVATVIGMAFWNLGCAIYLKRKLNITSYFNPFKF